jgi:CheY-like chemotaxis protein
MVRKLLVKVLQKLGSNVNQASDGQEAIDIIREKRLGNEEEAEVEVDGEKESNDNEKESAAALPFDLIIMDSVMPRVSGPEATEVVVQQLGFTNIVVGVTGNILPADITGVGHDAWRMIYLFQYKYHI